MHIGSNIPETITQISRLYYDASVRQFIIEPCNGAVIPRGLDNLWKEELKYVIKFLLHLCYFYFKCYFYLFIFFKEKR